MPKSYKLKKNFPFREIFLDFLKEYSQCLTYWYIPKARALREESGVITDIQKSLKIIIDEFLDKIWNQEIQDKLLRRLIKDGILEPYKDGKKQDRTALTRIHKKLWEVLGLVWVEENHEIIITDAGLEILAYYEKKEDPYQIIEGQIAKWQYPNPSIIQPAELDGVLPHLFLLQAIQKLDYRVDFTEFELFINLATSQNDVDRIVKYIKHWRDINDEERETLLNIVKKIPMARPPDPQQELWDEDEKENQSGLPTRYNRIHLNASYQRAFYTFPHSLKEENGDIICISNSAVDTLIQEKLKDLKIPNFTNKEDWFAYFGDPQQQPSWFTYLSLEVERAESEEKAKEIIKEGQDQLKPEEVEEIIRKQVEKGIEDFYVKNLSQIEDDLVLFEKDSGDKKGRQFSTPIGPVDLLCKDQSGAYVVIEIKVEEAKDSAFGQILRYIGWIHRNMEDGTNNVRGIILAGEFTEKARYSRIALEILNKKNYNTFLKFKKHGFTLQDT